METYQFIKQIGQGRYSDVWLVKGSKTKRNYVLKRIDFHRASKREQRSAHGEAKLLCTVKHPNIITYLDSFYNSKGSLFIVMSYCEQGNLHDFINNRKGVLFEEKEIINWLVQICMALKYLHDQSILHRDLKTQNIFLSRQKLIKVGDFGIPRIFNASNIMSNVMLSSPYYTSPEVFFGEPYGQKSDVWSLGCCAYEIATLKYAFIVQEISSSMHLIIQSKISLIPENYSSNLSQLISSMLDLQPEKRPNVTELLLQDYIRRHILLFLRDSSHRSSSSLNCFCKKKSTDSKISTDQASSLGFGNESKCLSVRRKIKEGMFISLPDINGNGDNNDNSQQQTLSPQAVKNFQIKPLCKPSKCKDNSSLEGELPQCLNGVLVKKSNQAPESDSIFLMGQKITNVKQLEKRISFYTQKMKSENSFQLLNTLTNSINVSRFKSLDSFSDSNSISLKTNNYYGEKPPKSAEDLFMLSKKINRDILRRPATSGEISCDVITCRTNNSCLPLIKENVNERNSERMQPGTVNLPPLLNLAELNGEKEAVEKNISLPNLEESIVDKFLLRNIMECNKIEQKSPTTCSQSSEQVKSAESSSIVLNGIK